MSDYENMGDKEVMKSVQNGVGGRAAFDILFRRYREQLTNFINNKIGDKGQAEDLAQETFIRAYKYAGRYDPEQASFSSWIHQIAANLVANKLRDRSRDPISGHLDDEGQFADDHYAPDEMAQNREIRSRIEAAVEHLPEYQREAFRLRVLKGLSYGQIAERTGTKIGTVKSRIHRARKQIREMWSSQ